MNIALPAIATKSSFLRKLFVGLMTVLVVYLVFLLTTFFLNKDEAFTQPKSSADSYVLQQLQNPSLSDPYAVGGPFAGFSPGQELLQLRGEHSKHFVNADGSITAQIGGLYHYLNGTGDWAEIDLQVVKGTSISGYSLQNETNSTKSYFPYAPGSRGVLMKLKTGQDFSWWTRPRLTYILDGSVLKQYPAHPVAGIAAGSKVLYPNIYPGMTEEFQMLSAGMESNTIIHELTEDLSALVSGTLLEFEQFIPLQSGWKIKGDGLAQESDFVAKTLFVEIPGQKEGINIGRTIVFDGGIDKNEAMVIQYPVEKLSVSQKELLEKHVLALDYQVRFVEGGVQVKTQLPASWLQESTRQFPVVIDPLVTITPPNSESYFHGPLTHWYGYQRHASLYLQNEIQGYGQITSIAFNSTNVGTAGSKPTRVLMRTENAATISSSAWNSPQFAGAGATLCLDQNTDQGNTPGWKELNLTTPFDYNQGNLLIMISDFWGGGGATKYYNQSAYVSERQAYNRVDNTDPGESASMMVENRLSEIRITYTSLGPCTGTPHVEVASASVSSICKAVPFTLFSNSANTNTGITYQWQSSNNGSTWANLGASSINSNLTTTQSQATYYRLIATCTHSNEISTSNTVFVNQNLANSCYLIPQNPLNCSDGDLIKNVTFAGINNTSGCNGGYSDYSQSVNPAQVQAGTTVPISVHVGPSGDGWLYESVMVWIDFNQDGVLDSLDGEYFPIGTGLNQVLTGNIVVPADAKEGTTRMRVLVMAHKNPSAAFANGPTNAYENYGEMEDYSVTITDASTKSITQVETLSDVQVLCPVIFGGLSLPTDVEVTYDDQTTETLSVIWDASTYTQAYGNYDLVGTLDLPTTVLNPLGLTAQIRVVVADTIAPNIVCVANQTAGTNTTTCKYLHSGTSWDATATDNCTATPVTLSYSLSGATSGTGTSLNGVTFNTGITTVTWTATDAAGLTNVCSYTVTVQDMTPPTALAQNVLLALDASGQAHLDPSQVDRGSNDICGSVTLTLSKQTFGISDIGEQTITLTVTDAAGNESLATAQVYVFHLESKVFEFDNSNKSLDLLGVLPPGTSLSYIGNHVKNAGTHQVIAKIDGGTNYPDLELEATLTINKAILTGVTLPDANYTYDGQEKSLAVKGVIPEGVTVRYEGNQVKNAGTYAVKAILDGGLNYQDAVLNATLTIQKATITGVTMPDANYTYDGQEKSLVIKGSLPAGVTVRYEGNQVKNAGTYAVKAILDGGVNYHNLELNATLTIDKATISGVTLGNGVFTYDGQEKSLAVAGSLPAGVTVRYEGNQVKNAGTYAVKAILDGGLNYQDAVLNATLTIQKATITGVTMPDANYTYDGQEKSLVIKGSLPAGVTVRYEGNQVKNAGTYAVKAILDGGLNYQDAVLNGTLLIRKAQQVIQFENPGDQFRNAGRVPLAVTTSSGRIPTLTVNDPLVATVSGLNLLVHRLGTVEITASLAGDSNYEEAAPVRVMIRVMDPSSDNHAVQVHPALSPNGDGINDFLIIEGIRDFPQNKFTLFSKNGQEFFTMSGYDNASKVFRGVANRGTSGTLSKGTYFYVLEFKDGAIWKVRKGYIVIR